VFIEYLAAEQRRRAFHLTVLDTAPNASPVLLALTALIAWGRRSQPARLLGS
jgi:hypothetical protein